jgi:hypothetical protein
MKTKKKSKSKKLDYAAGCVKIGEHSYPDRYAPGMGDPDLDEAWKILDTIKPGLIPPDARAFLAGQICGTIGRVRSEGRNGVLEEAAKIAQSHFVGIFTGWKGHTGNSQITLDEAEDTANECGPICAEAIRSAMK